MRTVEFRLLIIWFSGNGVIIIHIMKLPMVKRPDEANSQVRAVIRHFSRFPHTGNEDGGGGFV